MKYFITLAALLLVLLSGCKQQFASVDYTQFALATAASVDAQGDITDRPSIPDTLQGYKSGPVPPPTPEVERSSPAPSGVSINLYSADWCGPCKQHEAYWQARGWKGNGFTIKKVTTLPDWVETIPTYHWNANGGPVFVQCRPEQLQSSFDQTPKAGK